jgi:prepilin-type N-terminal cleavage/methylation domain-containing protein
MINQKNKSQKGFTLIEMIMVIIIISIISLLAIYQFSSTRRNASLQSTAEEIALNIRNAQSLALAVNSTGGFLPKYQNGFGVHFEKGGLGGAQDSNDHSYIIFTDYESNPGPGGWDRAYLKNINIMSPCGSPQQAVDECVKKIEISSGDRISDLAICSTSGGTPTCNSLNPGTYLDIVFLRPNLDAFFCTVMPISNGCRGLMPAGDYARITIVSPLGLTKAVNVWSTGQIEIK